MSGDEIQVPITVTDKKTEETAEITVKLEYQGREYVGKGTNLEWTDAFADLQKTLPEHIKLKCCLTCKHGTLCPYGNIPNYVLCASTERFKSKNDVIDWLDRVDVDSVQRTSFHSCESFEIADQKYYTYNDYLCYWKKQ